MNIDFKKEPSFIDELVQQRRTQQSGSDVGFIIGEPGAGKDAIAKMEIASILKNTDDLVVVLDAYGEYRQVADEMNGQIVQLAPWSENHINPFDANMNIDDSQGDPLFIKTNFIISWLRSLLTGRMMFSSAHETVARRCIQEVYEPFLESKSHDAGEYNRALLPILQEFHQSLCKHEGREAQELASSLEVFVSGSVDTFAHTGNVHHNNRLVVYDFCCYDSCLIPAVIMSVLEHVWHHVVKRSCDSSEKRVWVFISDAQCISADWFASEYIKDLFEMSRINRCVFTCISSSFATLSANEDLRSCLLRSNYRHLLRLGEMDRCSVAQTFGLSVPMLDYIKGTPVRHGLVYIDGQWDQCPREPVGAPQEDPLPKKLRWFARQGRRGRVNS